MPPKGSEPVPKAEGSEPVQDGEVEMIIIIDGWECRVKPLWYDSLSEFERDEMTCDWCGVSSVARTTGFEVEDLLDPEMEKKRPSFEETVKKKVKDRPDGYAVKLEKWSSELSDKPEPKSGRGREPKDADGYKHAEVEGWIHASGEDTTTSSSG